MVRVSKDHYFEGALNCAESAPSMLSTIKKRADFLALRNGAKAARPAFLLLARKNQENGADIRLGLTVTRKIGNSVRRNRIRRRLREAARQILPQYGAAGCDYVLIARTAAYDRNFNALLDDIKRALLTLNAKSI